MVQRHTQKRQISWNDSGEVSDTHIYTYSLDLFLQECDLRSLGKCLRPHTILLKALTTVKEILQIITPVKKHTGFKALPPASSVMQPAHLSFLSRQLAGFV